MTQICIFRLKFRFNICRYTCISIYVPWQYTLHFTKPSIPEKGGSPSLGIPLQNAIPKLFYL